MKLNLEKCVFSIEGEFFGFHVDPPRNNGQPRKMLNHNRDEKPSEPEGGAIAHRSSHRPLEVPPSASRANLANGETSSEDSQVLLG